MCLLSRTMRVLWETGHGDPVIHAPAVQVGEIGSEISFTHRLFRPQRLVAFGIVVDVVNREDERVEPIPGESEFNDIED